MFYYAPERRRRSALAASSANEAMNTVYSREGKCRYLGSLYATGGEGAIYPLLERADLLVKIYHAQVLEKRGELLQDKVLMMCEQQHHRNNGRLAWPLIPVYDAYRRWIGYAMYRRQGVPMAKLAHAMLYERHFPGLDRRRVTGYLLNLLRTIRELHDGGVMLGDCNLRNILCDPSSEEISLIDCDSFQVELGEWVYTCPVGFPDMTPEEHHGQDFSLVVRTQESEAFSIAIVLFMALMLGRHPYDVQGGGERAENLRRASFPYGVGNSGIPAGRWYNIWSHMPYRLKALFIRTLVEGAHDPRKRATLAEWINAIEQYRKEIDKGYHEVAMEPTAPKSRTYRGSGRAQST